MSKSFSAARGLSPELAERLPPNQVPAAGFPILHVGETPALDTAHWDLRVWGLVTGPERRFSWDEILALPQTVLTTDFHCVTRWTKFDNHWQGVRFRDFVAHVGVAPEARHVVVYGHLESDPYGYDANIPLAVLMEPDVLLATHHNGAPLTPDHGWPLRLVVPARYAWKSVKWVRGIEFRAEDRHGYWEERGYHNRAEPFAEERFAAQERPLERMTVHGKDDT